MNTRSLLDELGGTLDQLAQLIERNQQMHAYELARARLAFLRTRIVILEDELDALRLARRLLTLQGSTEGDGVWHLVANDLRSRWPAALHAPAAALASDSLDLLALVTFLAESAATARTHRVQLGQRLRTVLRGVQTSTSGVERNLQDAVGVLSASRGLTSDERGLLHKLTKQLAMTL